MSFWEEIRQLRSLKQIPRRWKRADIRPFLRGKFAANTIDRCPSNQSMTGDGRLRGNFILRGNKPEAWRIGRGTFELIEDPEDPIDVQRLQRVEASRVCQKKAPRLENSVSRRTLLDHSQLADRNRAIEIQLTDNEYSRISQLKKTEDKAVNVVERYLKDKHGEQNIEIDRHIRGADLRIVFRSEGRKEEIIEVKGTASPHISWNQLKVSSQQSHDNLRAGIPLYRVTNVNSRTPRILILKHGRDFVMEPEPRWAVRPVLH